MDINGIEIKCELTDLDYIKDQLKRLPYNQLMNGVINKYNEAYQSHDGTLQGKGKARRDANNRLRRYMDKIQESIKCY